MTAQQQAREHYETRTERRPLQVWNVGPRDGKKHTGAFSNGVPSRVTR